MFQSKLENQISFLFFLFSKVKAEFQRITTVNLEAKFMGMLDRYSLKLLSIFQAKKRAAGERHCVDMNTLLQVFWFTPLFSSCFTLPSLIFLQARMCIEESEQCVKMYFLLNRPEFPWRRPEKLSSDVLLTTLVKMCVPYVRSLR